MCELGSQVISEGHIPAKLFYKSNRKVLEHISLDLNGLHGSLVVDLCKPVHASFYNRFHLITNYGTAEHVNNQYQVFKNIHDMCKVNGIMIHVLPIPNTWPNHCRFYYPKDFFIDLSSRCNYKLLRIELKNANTPPVPEKILIYVVFSKLEPGEFISKKSFKQLNLVDTKVIRRVGNYNIQKYYQIRLFNSIKQFNESYVGRILFGTIFKRLYRIYYDLRH